MRSQDQTQTPGTGHGQTGQFCSGLLRAQEVMGTNQKKMNTASAHKKTLLYHEDGQTLELVAQKVMESLSMKLDNMGMGKHFQLTHLEQAVELDLKYYLLTKIIL